MYASRTLCSRCSSQTTSAVAQRMGAPAWYATWAEAADSMRRGRASASVPRNESNTSRNESSTNRRPFKPQKPRLPPKRLSKTPDESAVALFQSVVKPDASTEAHGTPTLSEFEIAGKLTQLVGGDLSLLVQYRTFRSTIWPSIQARRGQIPRHAYEATTRLLYRVFEAIMQNGTQYSSVELSQMYGLLGKWDLESRNELALNICYTLLSKKNSTATRTELLKELIGLWQHISQLRRTSEVGQPLRFVMPSQKDVLADMERTHGQRTAQMPATQKALTSIFLQNKPEQAREVLPALLATVSILSDARYSGPERQTEAAPLLQLVALVVSKYPVAEGDIRTMFATKARLLPQKQAVIEDYVEKQWHITMRMFLKNDVKWRHGLHVPVDKELAKVMNIGTFHKQLRTAFFALRKAAIISIWENLRQSMQHHPNLSQEIRADHEFLDFWIHVWCAIRRPARVQETMDLMKELDIQPSVKTFTAMMHGWKKCKDLPKIEALWEKLVESGMKLDSHIWTERISSLIELGQPQLGVKALSEMVDNWKQAVKDGRQDEAVQPSIEVVNAAFKGLLHMDARAANEILAWAGREGFEPNVRTYNILMQQAFRSDNSEDVQDLLRAMKNQGIEPDGSTFTIILEEVLGRMGGAEPAEQVAAVKQVFADIASAGLKPSLETYGKMLYAVVSLADGSDEAVHAVQSQMRRNGLQMTPHMITILIERAVARDPPDHRCRQDPARG
ncbi:hypothetical protein G7046_g9454 [Stylonectria norvegica]|nr:hypothetical protein G7046_g9454 [Stylonectria norvegica]